MSPKSGTPKKNLMLFSGRAHRELAEEVATHLNVTITPQTAHDFANGEIFVRFEESVRGTDAFVIQSHTNPINQYVNTWVPSTDNSTTVANRLSNPFPGGLISAPARNANYTTLTNGLALGNATFGNSRYGYTAQWNLTVQHEFGRGIATEVGYAASRGLHLPVNGLQLDQLPDQ